MIKILVADDHIVVRRGLKMILLDGFPGATIEEVGDAEDMLKEVIKSEWDVVISDLSMPGRSGLDVLPQIKQLRPNMPVLILSIHSEEQYALRVLKAGASGYLSKDLAPDELVAAVQKVMLGKKYITASIAEKLAAGIDDDVTKTLHSTLSDREFDVLKMLATGKTVSEIGEALFLSVTTISTYRSRILSKLNIKNNAELTLYAIENKLM
ncbi:MAG: response regulator transcription factor [Ferruginibacter sp.]|nr:response regulator transcription factor [Ferruginibacter sp.]